MQPRCQISMFQMFTMKRIHLDAGEAVRHWRRMPVGPGKTENISEPLPGMMGFICSHAVPWAVVRRWSACRSGGRRRRVEEESRQKDSRGGTTWKTKRRLWMVSSLTADLSFYISYFFIVFCLYLFNLIAFIFLFFCSNAFYFCFILSFIYKCYLNKCVYCYYYYYYY